MEVSRAELPLLTSVSCCVPGTGIGEIPLLSVALFLLALCC